MKRPVLPWPSALILLIVVLLCSGCRGQEPQPTPFIIYVTATPEAPAAAPPNTVPPPPEGQVEAVPPGESGPCEHLIWPLRDGAAWSYRLTTAQGASEFTLAAAMSSAGVTLMAGGETRSLICGDGSLAGLPPLPTGHPDLGWGFTGANPDGSYLPPAALLLPLGQPAGWDQELEAGGTIRLPPAGDTALPVIGGRLALIHEAEPLETVSVPAGTFLALPVRQDALFDVQVQMPDGTARSVLISAVVQLAYAEGVGLLLARYEGGMISTPGEAWPLAPGPVLELIGASLP